MLKKSQRFSQETQKSLPRSYEKGEGGHHRLKYGGPPETTITPYLLNTIRFVAQNSPAIKR